jgi:hypothetical protein
MVVKFEIERGHELGVKKTYKNNITLDTKRCWCEHQSSKVKMICTKPLCVPNCITTAVPLMCEKLNGWNWWMKWGNGDQYEWTLGGELVNKTSFKFGLTWQEWGNVHAIVTWTCLQMGVQPYVWIHNPCTKMAKKIWTMKPNLALFVDTFASFAKSKPTFVLGTLIWSWCVNSLKEVILKLQRKRCRSHHKDDAMYRTCPWFLSRWKTREVGTKEITKNVFIFHPLKVLMVLTTHILMMGVGDMPLVWDSPQDHLMSAHRSVVDSHGATKSMFHGAWGPSAERCKVTRCHKARARNVSQRSMTLNSFTWLPM